MDMGKEMFGAFFAVIRQRATAANELQRSVATLREQRKHEQTKRFWP